MTLLRFLLLGYALITIFIAGGLFFKKAGHSYTLLSVFGLLFGLEMLRFLYGTSTVLVNAYPEFVGYYYFEVGFLYGPVLWFHFRFFINPDRSWRWTDALHLLPAIAVFVLLSDVFLMPPLERIAYLKANFLNRTMLYNYARSWHIMLYGAAIVYLVYRNFQLLTGKKRLYALAICTVYFITAVFLSWLVGYAWGWRQFVYYYLCASTMVFIIGFVLYRDPQFLTQITRKYLHSAMPRTDMQRIAGKINAHMSEERIFLQKDLTLRKLSDLIEEKPHKISQTLSEYLKVSFNDLVNRARIGHAKEMLKDKSFDHYKIEAIALESGFNNKVTFHKAFQKFQDCTPASYRDS